MGLDLNSNSYIASTIDHTLLKPEATFDQIKALTETAIQYGFFSVCIQPCFVAAAAEWLKGSEVKVCTVIGFPLGANTTETKAFETKKAIQDGAHEVDMVINIGALKSKKSDLVEADIRAVVKAAEGKTVKVIIETALLTEDEIREASMLTERAGAHFVKTSTGFSTRGATLEDIAIIKSAVSAHIKIKASGGVKDLAMAKKMLLAGASRLGTSSGVTILKGMQSTDFY